MTMDASSREPLLRQAMDRLAHGVCEWKASAQPFCTDTDVGVAHKDGLYRIYRESGLQPWEFHTVLHRALEYGMVEPQLQQLWSEVAAAVVQHPLSEHGPDVPEGQAWGHVSRNTAAVGNGGMYNEHWMPANGRSSSAPVRPPGLGDSKQPHNSSAVALTAAGSRLSPDTDTSCSSSIDQRNGRKQQPPVAAGAKQVARAPAVVTKGAAKQQHVHAIEELVRGQSGARGSNSTQPVAGSQAAHDLPQNGLISAYRYDVPVPGATGSDAAVVAGQQQVQESNGVATRLTGTSSDQQQGRKQQQRGGWEVQEPLDLLPSGLLDDVYDQGDAVVDAPAAAGSSLLSNAAGVGKHSSNGIVSRVLAPTGTAFANGEEAAGSSRNKQRQQKQSVAAAPAGDLSIQQQWHEPDRADQQQRQPRSRNGSLDGATPFVLPVTPNGSILNVSMFSGQQQPYGTAMQPLPQQSLAYSQQQLAGLGPASWGTAAVGSYMQPSLLGAAPGGAVQPPPPPPPPPRGHTWTSAAATPAGGAAGLASGTVHGSTAAMSAAGSASGQSLNYAAVAAAGHLSHRAQQHAAGDHSSNGHLSAFLAPSDAVSEAENQRLKNHAALKTGSNHSDGFGQRVQMYQPPAAVGSAQHQQHPPPPAVEAAGKDPAAGSNTEDAVVPPPAIPAFGGLSLFHTASLDSPVTPAVGGPMSPYPSPLQRTLSASTGASPALPALGLAGASGSSVGSSSGLAGMAPMLLPPSAVPSLGAIGEPVGSLGSSSGRMAHFGNGYQQSDGQVHTWSSFGPAVGSAAADASQQRRMQQQQQQQQQQTPIGSVGSVGTGRLAGTADGSTCSAESSGTAVTASSVATPHSLHAMEVSNGSTAAAIPADTAAGMRHPPPPPPPPPRMSSLDDQQLGSDTASDVSKQPPPGSESPQQQQQPPPPAKPMTWAQKLLTAKSNGSNAGKSAAAPTAAAAHARTAAVQGSHAAAGPRIAPAPLSETQQQGGAAAANLARRGGNTTTGQALLAAAKQQEAEAEAAAAAAVPSYSEAAALDGLDAVTAKAAVTAASRMPLPAKMIQAWRSGLCLSSCIKLLQSQRSDLGMALNDRIKGWLCQDCDRATAECLVLFVLTNLRRDWHVTAKSPGAFLMGLLQHRAAMIGGSGMSKKLLEVARNFPNVAVYIDSDVLQELGDMESSLRSFIMDEYMCKQRHDWPEGLKFPSQCLLSCMRSIRYADPAVHQAYINLMETRPDLSKAMNGVILYGLCKCDASTGLAAVKRLSELPAEWTSAARVNASAFLYQKVQELCGGHCY